VSPIDFDGVPGLDTTAIRIAPAVVTAPFARRPFFKGGRLFRHAVALILAKPGRRRLEKRRDLI
jgi:hypothetical protein